VQLCGAVRLSVSKSAFSLNGHGSLYSIPAEKALLMVPTLGQKSPNMQSKFHNPASQQYSSSFLVWTEHNMLLQAVTSSWLQLSSSLKSLY
jgi:hypothetical protein